MGTAAAATSKFPAVYAGHSTAALLSVFEAAPPRISRALENLSPADLAARVVPGKWTIQEIVCHVVDSETCGALRMRLCLAQPGSPLPGYDPDRFAEGLGYAGFDAAQLSETVDLFARLRGVSARLLRGSPEPAWRREAVHPKWGAVTLRQLLEVYADHGERHLSQILERRRLLGRPVEVEPILPERLY